mmetsp:Transcript_82901/g.261856  ORF Transcript_82901/g.261856 Transcript_82901/m.261856 type:complete len:312 (+) Transcript_82901:64-999(+)
MFSARGSLRAGRGRGARALPVLLPCLVFTVAGLALFSALISLRLPQPSEDFVGGRGAAPQRMLVQREYKPRITDRGTPEYEKYMEEQRALREQMWNAQNRDINAKVGGIDSESAPPPPPRAAPAPAPAPASAPAPAPPAATGVADKNSLHKLFESLDRGGGGQVSRRDVLVALRRHPPVRRLFGLPVTNVEPGGDALEARLLAIQDSFEAGSGLGELAPAFDKLREASGGGQSFSLEAFLASCRTGPLRAGARQAAALLPREHATGAAFVPTHLWAEVPGDAVCPGGLEYKMDMSTGKTLARLPPGVAAAA